MLFICDFWLIYNNTLNAPGERETQACGLGGLMMGWVGGCAAAVVFLLETVNLISQHSSHNRKSNSVRAALSISCLAAQVDKCTAELIYSAYILDILMLFFFFVFFSLVTQLPPSSFVCSCGPHVFVLDICRLDSRYKIHYLSWTIGLLLFVSYPFFPLTEP